MRILTYTVTPEEDGRMVKGILRGSLQLSYTLLKSLKWRENAILLNGQSVHVNTIVHAGDTVSVVLSERTPREDLYCANAAKPTSSTRTTTCSCSTSLRASPCTRSRVTPPRRALQRC